MKLARFSINGSTGYGIIDGGKIHAVASLFDHRKTGAVVLLSDVTLLAPCEPTKIICGGLNYTDHAAEMKMPLPHEPIIFLKPQTAVLAPGETIKYPRTSHQVDYEAELAVVIGKTAKDIKPEDAGGYILGYTCFNDVTARDLQKKDGQWTRAKSFDTFAPFGPWIETELNPDDQLVEAYLNGEKMQSSSTENMHFSVFEIVAFISTVMTLNPGDIIATGTPPGIGPMQPGDIIEIKISGIGTLTNRIER
jgi:2-keto-4-pentenoate hydratase/2-oxohepta-3-ene-1,7-dioic acid hydratase in catechol pathway